jgi:hypothetical protein
MLDPNVFGSVGGGGGKKIFFRLLYQIHGDEAGEAESANEDEKGVSSKERVEEEELESEAEDVVIGKDEGERFWCADDEDEEEEEYKKIS